MIEPPSAGLPRIPAYYPFPNLPGIDPSLLNISIVDVGAEPLDFEGDIYEAALREGHHRIVGFDPFADESIREARGKVGSAHPHPAYPNVQRTVLPYFLGTGEPRTFHLNRFSPTSSLFPSNKELLSQFMHLSEMCETVRTIRVATRRLDDVEEIESCDFLKVDVQGGDYDVVAHGTKVLEKTLFVHIEAEFSQIYVGQPLFSRYRQALAGPRV